MNKKNTNRFTFDSRIDYGLLLPAFLLLVIGLYSIYVATMHDHPENTVTTVMQQGSWMIVGIFVALVVMHLDSRLLWKLTPIFYGVGLVLLLLPRFFYDPVMYSLTGSYNWISIGGHNLFQPSEFMKIAYILFLARIIVSFQNKLQERTIKQDFRLIGQLILATIPVAILAMVQGDLGTFMVFGMIFVGVVLVSGVSWKIILPAVAFVIAVGGGIVAMVLNPSGQKILVSVFHQYQVNRFLAWLHPFEYSQTFSLQQARSLMSVGTGGLFGKGIGQLSVDVPVRESDMIFTVIAENFGFIGAAFVIFLYFMLIYRMIRVTFKSNNQFYMYISTGIIMMILFHVFENIGAAIGVVPLTGIPLPFISQGGSALMANIIGLALVLSMKYNQLPEFIDKKEVWETGRTRLAEKKLERAKKRRK